MEHLLETHGQPAMGEPWWESQKKNDTTLSIT